MTLPALEDSLEGVCAGILPQGDPSMVPQNRHCPHPDGTPSHSWDTSPDLPRWGVVGTGASPPGAVTKDPGRGPPRTKEIGTGSSESLKEVPPAQGGERTCWKSWLAGERREGHSR